MDWIRTAQILGVLAILASTFWAGHEWRDRSADLELAELKATHAEQERTWESDMLDAAIDTATASIERDKARKQKAKVITREVIRYVSNPDIPRIELPSEWVLLHDQAWGNAAAAASAEPFTDGSAPVTDADAAAVSAHNAEVCGQAISGYRDLREFYQRVREAGNGG